MLPKGTGSAVWNDAEKLSSMKPERNPVDLATWRKVSDNRRRNLHGVKVLGGVIGTYFYSGFKKEKQNKTLKALFLKQFGKIRKI